MNYEEQKAIRELNCNACSVWAVQFTPFWQWASVWAKRLSDWVTHRAQETATYTLLRGVNHEI